MAPGEAFSIERTPPTPRRTTIDIDPALFRWYSPAGTIS